MNVKTTRLRLKGDKKKRKKRKSSDNLERDLDGAKKREDIDPVEWVYIRSAEDLNGPIVILTSVTETPSALSQVSQNGLKFTDLGAETSIGDWAPDSTSYVMISARVSGNQFTLKTPAGRYIGVDSTGGLTCERNAAGQTEIFELISREDGVSLKTFGGFLSCDSNGVVRADSDAIGSREVFRIKTQYQFLAREKTEEEDPGGENPNSLRNYLTPLMTKYQSTSTIRGNFLTPSNIKAIKKARKEDALHETLLNIREKLKSDKFCK